MPSLSLKIILEDGAVTRTMKFPNGATVADAVQLVEEKVLTGAAGKDYGLFLTSADDELSGCWLEDPRRLDYYLLKDGDSLHYRCRVRNLKIRMLDGAVKTMQVDESKPVETLMMNVCTKLGITNYEEYGLCREDEPMEEHPSTGTLTLKRKHQHKEKDAALQQLSKKLKTDDNVEWLEQNKTLREMAVAPNETLLLKRRLFYSDRKVDARDPVQLNLLYVQARDAVLEGRHPVTEEQAAQFAGIQCQVQYGDYQEEKHKHGFIENLSEFLPQNYANAWGIEKKVTKEHSKHTGLSQIEAKHLYTKTARDLPTYGVTFFLVKEMQKGKKKLVPRLLGINASSILRLDETTKEVLQVWPLTQVKTYKAGRGEMFTLNFGDYSEKEYCVKTNDAYRIRDILQGYIDLIRKKMEAAFNSCGDEGGVIHSATVESSKGTTMEVVSHSAHKGVETSFVGPSKIVTAETGSKAQSHGAQIVTAHTVIVTNKQHNEQSALATNATMRGEMSIDTGKKLNDLNANAVKIVTLLNDPNEANIEEAKKIIDIINRDSPTLVAGVKHCIDQQTDEAAKKKLTFELSELNDNIVQLNDFNSPQEAQEAAMRIADLTTQMYFALDARVKRRSLLVRNSRKSFIEDEKTQATLHRASFINCVGAANHAIDDARDTLTRKYEGPALSPEEVDALERSARDRLAKLNAAIARLAAAHADPKNIDYAEAVSAMNTIRELVPRLANDAQVLSAVKDGKDRRSLIKEMQELLDATGKIAQNIGCDDLQKMQNETDNFAKKSRRLQFIFGHGAHPDKENEIIDLAKDADDKTRLLVATANQLASEVNDPESPKVKHAADKCANDAGGLTSCAQLTASSIHEPHCRSALSAAVEDLSSSEKLLETAYRPLLEHPEGRNRSDLLKHQSADLKKALDRLRDICSAFDGDADMDGPEARERKRLQFVHNLSGGQKALDSCDKILKDKYKGPALGPKEAEQLERSARDRLAKLNAAIARLAAAHADPDNVDYAVAAEAMETIKELAPELATDAQALSTVKDGKDRSSLIKELQEILDSTGRIYQNIENKDLQKMQEEAKSYAIKARRLQFILGQVDDKAAVDGPETERQRLQFVRTLSGGQKTLDSCDKILKDKYKGPALSPKEAEALEKSARDRLAKLNAAIARLTAAHADPNNIDYAAAAEAMDTIKELAPDLANGAQALSTVKDGKDRAGLIKELQEILDSTGKIYQSIESKDLKKMQEEANNYNIKARRLQFILGHADGKSDAQREREKLQFVSTLSEAQETLDSCDKFLTDGSVPKVYTGPPLWKGLGDLNAAIASLVAATRDSQNPDYPAADRAMAEVVHLMPFITNEIKRESAYYPAAKRDETRADGKALCDMVRALALITHHGEDPNQAVADYAHVSGKLTYVFDKHAVPETEHEIIDLAKSACGRTSELLAYVYGVAAEVGGQGGEELDTKGTKVADAAQELLSCIQLNTPTIHTARSKSVVLQSARDLESAMDNLAKTWPVACRSQEDKQKLADLNKEAKKELHHLMVAVQKVPDAKEEPRPLRPVPQTDPKLENKKLCLGVSLSHAREAIDKAEMDLKKPLSAKPLTPVEASALQHSLADKLASLNAAISGLMMATRDQSSVNYKSAEASVGVIQRLVPEVVEDVRTLSSGKDEAEKRLLMEELRALCAATKALGEGTRHGNPEELKTAVRQYAKSAGRLTFVCTPHTQIKKNQEQVVGKANNVFDRSSSLVAAASKLASEAADRGEEAQAVVDKARKAEYAANSLLTAAELSALTVNAPQCQSAIHQAAAELSQAVTQLGQAAHQLVGADLLGQQRHDFDDAVRELMATIKALEGDSQQLSAAEKEKNRLKFVASRSAAQKALDNAAQELKKTGKVAPLAPPQAALLQAKLADRLATLNAAIATLLTATRDPQNPDYVLAESATATIQELMPDLIKDAKTLPAGKDEAARSKLLENLQALCDATKALSSGEYCGKEDELQEAVIKFTDASGKLVYTFNPRANPAKEGQIIDLTKSTCQKTSELLEKVYDLARGVDGQASEELDARGARLADAAQNLLTTAEITATSISSPLCQSSLLTSVSALSSSVEHLFSSTAMTLPQQCAKREQLQQARAKVDQEIERLKEALKEERVLDAATVNKAKRDKLRFIASMASAEVAVQNAEKEITEPYGKPLPASAAAALEESLANRLASLNAAINSLVVATSDHTHPDYLAAESASKTIRELIPDIVKDSKSLSSSKDPKSRKELLEQIKALCEATRRLGVSAKSDQFSPEELNKAATQYSLASGKLNFVFNPHADQKKTHQIIDTCKSTCHKTSEMLQRVHELTKQTAKEGAASADLDSKGSAVSDAARALLTTAQLTAHSTHSVPCQSALLSASDHLSTSIQELQAAWVPVVKAPKFKASGEQLAKDADAVEAEIVTLRRLVTDDGKGVKGKRPPAVPVRTGSLKKAKPKAPEARVIGATREFLDRLRCESSMEKDSICEPVKSPTTPSRTDEEKRAKLAFTKSVQDARKSICTAEDVLQAAFNSDVKVRASLDDAQIFALNKQMEHKLARANAAAAHLLSCRGGDKPDYKLASKCVGAVSDLMPTIATDAITLADLKDPVGRKLFLSDTLGLCTASKALCDTAKTDKKKLKEVAVTFGNHSSKLLYGLQTDIDPSQEKEILLRVKAAGDVACRVTETSAEGPAAGRCASQATLLMYTAKLVAPSIQDPECQDSLITASNDLSAQLKNIPTSKDPKMAQELQDLEKILEALRSDVASGKLVKRKEEKLTIEDTPLRKLTAQIIEDAKQNAECTTNSAEERRAMADFANKLTDALKTMDVANARCKKAPHDMKKREELEDAVLNLQQLVLQCRPRGGAVNAAQSNIVNLSDFLQDVSTNADRLNVAATGAEQSGGAHARAAAAVAAQCRELRAAAASSTTDHHGLPMLDVDHAAKECVSRVQKINTTIECCPEGAGKTLLHKEARPLNESSTLLQYASQSALATAQCAALDEALNDLTDLEHRIDKMLQPRQGEKHVPKSAPSPSLLSSRARLATAAAGAGREAQELAPAFTRYVQDMRAHVDVADTQRRMRLAEHLKKLQDRLKLLTMETGRQVVTWRPANEGEVVAITEDILKELDNAEAVIGAKTEKTQNHIAYEDLKKLLLPVDTYKMEGDKKKLEAKLEPYATKLNSMAETLTLSIGKPGSLARSAHVTAESAVQLTALAKALKSDEDPTKNSKIDETSQELCFVTYNLLKTAEAVSEEPNTFESRRRMMDACRSLNEAINKLVRASSSGDKLQRECNELNRALQLRQGTLQPRPTCALAYADCVSALQTQHEAIKNLKSEEPVSREEFSTSLDLLASAVSNKADYAEHCAYLLSVSEQHPQLAKDGMFDTVRVQKMIATAQDSCFRVTRPGIVDQAKEESCLLSKQLLDLKQAIQECSTKVRDEGVKRSLLDASGNVDAAGLKLQAELNTANVSVEKVTPTAFSTIEALSALRGVTEHPRLAPAPAPAPAPAAQKRADEVIEHSKELLNRASGLMRAIKTSEDQQAMTWVMFNTYTKGVIEISEKLVQCIRESGQQAGLIEGAIEEDDVDMTSKSYVQTQVLIANKWLQKPTFKAQIKMDGEQAARNVIEVGKKMMTHLKEAEREEMGHLVQECEQLLAQCSVKYTLETGSVLMDRLKDLAKAVDRSIVTMVVEDLIDDEEPLADLDLLVDAERDEAKRKFLLERKIADLLAHLGRVTKTARVVADGQGGDGVELHKCSNQAELLAPMLVKAAEKRVMCPTETAVVEEYQTQLAQYAESLSRVRDLCDRAVDPMQFVQTAEETMQRMKEESTAHQNDLQKCTHTSTAIRKLAHRVINVSMSSQNAQRDPELMRALAAAQLKLKEAEPQRALRASKLPDWRNNITEILRATGEVESVLGGEMIFKEQRETDQPIYNAALNLHAAVREWSARDNEIVAVAKRTAVLMAKLSDHMHADRKREVISTSKAIVTASHEVARLARKLALECTDMRIRTNLLQVCDQIPTISGQLKMLTTVKGSFLGHQGSDEDIEAMNMLIGNAQNLMMSIQDVVKAAASASVKIRSQRGGPKIRWVRKNYH